MIDLHCHILPSLDDGSKSLEESLSMARIAADDGIRTIVASPHSQNGTYSSTPQLISSITEKLQNELDKNKIDLHICTGAEIHIYPGLHKRVAKGEETTINDTGKFILVEFPLNTIPAGIQDEIFFLKMNGITPVIAHPERNTLVQSDMDIIYDLVRLGSLCQVTAMSIVGDFGRRVMHCAEKMIGLRLAHVIASDAHSSNHRSPVLSGGIEAAAEILGSRKEAMRMVTDVPAAILSGEIPEIAEPYIS